MPRPAKRIVVLGLALLAVGLAVPAGLWVSLSYRPRFYRSVAAMPKAQRRAQAQRFQAQSLQLYNDIRNEPRWEAVFTDDEVNAWLAEDLVMHFADQLPPEIHEPRVVFEADRVTLAFLMDRGPFRSVISVVARARVPEPNQLELTLEKIRAGAVPVSADSLIDQITARARDHGLDIRWRRAEERPVALIRYTPDLRRSDVVLEQVHIRQGHIRLAGRSNRVRGPLARPTLPRRKVLQSAFPRRNTQAKGGPVPATLRSSASPTS